MSLNNETAGPGASRPRSSLLKFMMNVAIFGFFVVGIVVSAGSFGLFGCWCNEGFVRREKPAEKIWKDGEMPPNPSPLK